MKNLMIYISPTGSFDNPRTDLASNDAGPLAKVQIENSLALGWKSTDIILVTNFDYQYGTVKAIVLNNVEFFERKPQASKINAIVKLFENGLVNKNEMYWFHDLDAFQLTPIAEGEISILEPEIAVTDFGGAKRFAGKDRWSGGVFYFKSGSSDIFQGIKNLMYQKRIDEEEALGLLVAGDQLIKDRVVKINNSYNFIGYNFREVYQRSIKPIKVVHFHPRTGKRRLEGVGKESAFRFFTGENPLGVPLLTDDLIRLFKYHRIV